MKVPYGKQSIEQGDIDAVVEVLRSDFLTQGPTVLGFESEFAQKVGAKFAVSFCNATAALHSGFKLLNKDPHKKVIVPPITFAASSNCVLYEKGQVEFVDIKSQSLNLDLDLVEAMIEKSPESYQGIIPVDFGGLPTDTERLASIAKKYGLWVMQDSCHAIGASFITSQNKEISSGSGVFTDLSVFSFHPVKHIAAGEGGMITTDNEKYYHTLLRLRSHGIERDEKMFESKSHGGWYTEMQELGFNYRMSDINAALGLSQLKKLDGNIQKRREIARKYREALKGYPLEFQDYDPAKFKHAFHLFVIKTKKRKELYDFLKANEVYAQVHYLPVYKHPYYQNNGFRGLKLSASEDYYSEGLSLPMYHGLKVEEQDFVIGKIKEFFHGQ